MVCGISSSLVQRQDYHSCGHRAQSFTALCVFADSYSALRSLWDVVSFTAPRDYIFDGIVNRAVTQPSECHANNFTNEVLGCVGAPSQALGLLARTNEAFPGVEDK